MDWALIIGFILTGGIGTAVVNQAFKGWQQRSRAKGRLNSRLDALTRSRLWLLEVVYLTRRKLIESGGTPPPFIETEDPYLVWEEKNTNTNDKAA